ncbi:hypothetical protein OI71_22290 [Aeromonas hydrophila]|nr:hypothetical protein OI71_22290 [Aeromonas hydrophila]
MLAYDRFLQFIDLFVERFEVLVESHQQLAKHPWQAIFTIFQEFGYTLADVGDALRDDEPIFRQQSSDLVGLGGPGLDESLPCPMQRQDGRLLTALNRHETHGWSSHRFTISLGISSIVFVSFDVRLDELRRHQLDSMPHTLQLVGPKVCATPPYGVVSQIDAA